MGKVGKACFFCLLLLCRHDKKGACVLLLAKAFFSQGGGGIIPLYVLASVSLLRKSCPVNTVGIVVLAQVLFNARMFFTDREGLPLI